MRTIFSELTRGKSEMGEESHVSTKKNPIDHQSGLLNVKEPTLCLHKGPGFDYAKLAILEQGDKLKFINFSGDWVFVKVISLGIKGWVPFSDVE